MAIKQLRGQYNLWGYSISDEGKVYNSEGVEMTIYEDGTSFFKDENGVKKRIQIHHLVAELFVPKPTDVPDVANFKYVLFKDGNKKNRNASNLRWSKSRKLVTMQQLKEQEAGDKQPRILKKVAVLERRSRGYRIKEIVEELGVSPQYVHKVLRENALL